MRERENKLTATTAKEFGRFLFAQTGVCLKVKVNFQLLTGVNSEFQLLKSAVPNLEFFDANRTHTKLVSINQSGVN